MFLNVRQGQTLSALAVAYILVFATTGQYAFGDTLVDNLSGSATSVRLNPGESQAVTYWINNQGPACDFSVADPVTVNINGLPSGITATPSSLTFEACGDSITNIKQITYQVSSVSPPLANEYPITFASADPTGDPLGTTSANIDIFVKPPAPTLSSPANGAIINDNTPALTWNAIDSSRLPASPAFTYEIQVDDNSDFSTPLVLAGTTGILSSITTYTVPSSLPDGTYNWHVRAKQSANTGDYSTVAFSFIVNTAPAPTDNTEPEISYTVNGVYPEVPNGDNGWYTIDANLVWTVSEPESPDSLLLTGCNDTLVDYDTTGVTFSCGATSDGGTVGPVEVTIKRDASAPTVTHTLVPATPEGENGWYVSDIDLSWTYGDTISGIDGSLTVGCVDQILNTDFDTTTFSCDVTNNAGLSNSDSVDLKRDATDPEVALVGGPDDGADYYFGFVPDEPTCEASDATSGLAGDCVVSGYETGVGTHTVQAGAEDNAGNAATDAHTYDVLAWDLFGFYSPVEMDGVFNVIKGGQTVPLKFNVFAGATELTEIADVNPLKYKKIYCDYSGEFDTVDVVATGGTVLRYDTDSGQFVYNWKTPTTKNTCWELTLTTVDGSALKANFKTK